MKYLLDTHVLIWAVQHSEKLSHKAKETIMNESNHKLPRKENHKDSFDRMLIWQSITSDFTLISKDSRMKLYKDNGLAVLW